MAKNDPFEASASALGYLYQFAKALELCIERSMNGLDWSVAVEAADDIETHAGSLTELLQLKQRAEGTRLTDTSEDLWKTLRIWCEADLGEQIVLDETALFLLTTADLSVNSAGYYLQPRETGHRDVDEALRLLRSARQASKSKKLQESFKAFDSLEESKPGRQREMLSRVDVIGHSPRIDEIRSKMIKHATLAVDRDFTEAFLGRLEGWFYGRVIEQLTTSEKSPITGEEFDEVFSRLRGQFSHNNLPIDPDIKNLEPESIDSIDKTFVRQLDLIGVGPDRVHLAVRDYIRAFAQRSRWSEEKLLRPGELGDYERRLVEEWQAHFAEMKEELGAEATDREMKREARQIYKWVDQQARAQIRDGLQEVFIPKGSYHMLADELRVGWHPEFSARLAALLEPAGVR